MKKEQILTILTSKICEDRFFCIFFANYQQGCNDCHKCVSLCILQVGGWAVVWVLCSLWQWISAPTAVVSAGQGQWQCAVPAARSLHTQGPAPGKDTLHGALLSPGASTAKNTGRWQPLSGISLYCKSGTVPLCHWLSFCPLVAEHLSSCTREELCGCNYLSDQLEILFLHFMLSVQRFFVEDMTWNQSINFSVF